MEQLGRAPPVQPWRLAQSPLHLAFAGGDWLNLLGFALEKRRFGCYRPPLASAAWQQRLAGWERLAGGWQGSGGGVYLLVARKMVVGLRPAAP